MNKSGKQIQNQNHKNAIWWVLQFASILEFLWVTKDHLGSPGKILAPSAPPRSALKSTLFSLFPHYQPFYNNSRVSRHPKKLFLARLASSLPTQKVSIISVKKCVQEKYFCQVVQFGTNIALYVKCSKMRLYISSRGHFKQLWASNSFYQCNKKCLNTCIILQNINVVAYMYTKL